MASHVTGNDLSTVGPSAAHGCAVTGEGCQNLVGFRLHALTVLSEEADAARSPSGLIATLLTPSESP